MIAVEQGEDKTIYTYDPFHRRLSKTYFKKNKQQKRELYFYDEDNEIGSTDEKGAIQELRVLGEGLGAEIGAAVFIELKGKTYVPLHDHRGCVTTLLDTQTNKPINTYRYTAFGEEQTQNQLSPWRFSSKRIDPESNLVYFGRRYYSPSLGRWTSPDPQGFQDGPNLYAYVHNNPLASYDLYGLWTAKKAVYDCGNAAFDFGFPCAAALNRLPPEAPLWQRAALSFGAAGEVALLACPPAKLCASLTEKSIIQISRSALARQAEKQFLRTTEKTATLAAERKIANKSFLYAEKRTTEASSNIQYQQLKSQLAREEASSIFKENGTLKQHVVERSKEIIPAGRLKNPNIPNGYSKYTTGSFSQPSGKFEVHFYKHNQTGEVFYDLDYKSILLKGN